MPAATPFRTVWFDCDSTLSAVEGIDELALDAAAGVRDEVAALTLAAMEGRVPLAEVYPRRLALLRPDRRAVEALGRRYVDRIVPHATLVVDALQSQGKRVGVVSGGLLPAVRHVAQALGIADADVHGVDVRFAPDGAYLDFDRQSPLWRNGGKPAFLRARPARERPLAFVGDGITDLEAAPAAELFVGFGGVAVRARVRAEAACFILDLRELLPILLTADELQALARHPRLGRLLRTP
ncbi:MAG: HAD-IB family phosphatase [Planctomycetes bacterium]|nr:HAD-IB family phosphatase [Planctomycetota bacterium]